jgi:hypothetical protein
VISIHGSNKGLIQGCSNKLSIKVILDNTLSRTLIHNIKASTHRYILNSASSKGYNTHNTVACLNHHTIDLRQEENLHRPL